MEKTFCNKDIEVKAKEINVKVLEFKRIKNKICIEIQCFKCGKKYIQRKDSFLASKGCKYCIGQAKPTLEEVENYISSIGYQLLSKTYKNSDQKLDAKCNNGHIFHPTYNNFKNKGSRCPYCVGGIAFKYEKVKENLKELGYELLDSEYINSKTPLKVKCKEGHIIEREYNSIKEYPTCPKCYNSTRRLKYEYVKKIIESEEYILLSTEYKNKDQKLQMICPKGHFYEATFGNFRNGFRCPQCHKISKGERAIQQFLEKAKIEYRFQYTFKECKNIIALPFDFYIPKFCTCIEYDGEQHFMPVTFGGISKKRADIKFKQVQLRDEIKNKYCLDNNIRLIRIPYWNFDKIEEILLKELDV